jgi:hypothetical protein
MLTEPETGKEEWKKTIMDYDKGKKALEWTMNPPVKHVTQKEIKSLDTRYNPILQRYNNNEIESRMRRTENDNVLTTLAQNKV